MAVRTGVDAAWFGCSFRLGGDGRSGTGRVDWTFLGGRRGSTFRVPGVGVGTCALCCERKSIGKWEVESERSRRKMKRKWGWSKKQFSFPWGHSQAASPPTCRCMGCAGWFLIVLPFAALVQRNKTFGQCLNFEVVCSFWSLLTTIVCPRVAQPRDPRSLHVKGVFSQLCLHACVWSFVEGSPKSLLVSANKTQ